MIKRWLVCKKNLKEWPCMWQNNEDIPDFD